MLAIRNSSAPVIPDFKTLTRNLLAGLASVAIGLTCAAADSNAGGPRKISGASPFANCVADNPTGQAGTLFTDSEIEPWIDVNPVNKRNLIAAWQQDRWSNGGARGLASGVSIDGGATWATIVPPKVTLCSGGIYDRASDPWVSFGPSGRAYFMSLSFMNDRPDGGAGKNAMLVSRSLNGGISWGPPVPLIIDTDGQIFNDKNMILADPLEARYVYAVWDRIIDYTLPSGSSSGQKAGNARPVGVGEGSMRARERLRRNLAKSAQSSAKRKAPPEYKGPTVFVRSTNGGKSWEPPKVIYDPGGDAQTINNLVVVLKSGAVANVFTNISSVGDTHIGIQKSLDKGKSFGKARLPVATNITFTGTLTPDSREPVRDANILFDVAVDRANGNLYLVWQDGRWGNIDRVAFSMSTDGGTTWSTPARINMTPPSTVKLRNQAFVPSVEVGAHHEIVVTYYDFRLDKSNGAESTDFFAVFCTPSASNDCGKRSTWGDGITNGKDVRITTQSFNMLDAPVARGHFLGDYMGLVRRGNVMMPAFGIADSLNHTSINTRGISSREAATATND